jgi:hypothetical protein
MVKLKFLFVSVLYRTAAENISLAEIQSQIDVLNADFNALNSDFNSVYLLFSGLKLMLDFICIAKM